MNRRAVTCDDCVHYVPATGRCVGAGVVRVRPDLSFGVVYQPPARDARGERGECGPTATRYTPRQPLPWWRRLLRRIAP